MNENSRWSRLTTRTTVITVAAIAGVVIAGGAAVAANIGILDAADDDELGTLSAAVDLSGGTEIIDVYPQSTTSTSLDDGTGTQAFTVDRAGLVTVARNAGALRVAEVVANPGWTWTVDADDAATVAVRFTDGARTLVFTATLGADGTVAADVSETTPPPVVGPTGSDDDHDDDHGEDEHEHEDEQEHEDEHEGRDDDD